MRGGTSKGVFLRAEDLPSNPDIRDQVILSVFGSPDIRQIDGLGGADPLTSKVAIIGRSSHPDADVDYTAGYVGIGQAHIDYEGNCGNISQAVGPFAIDEGLVEAVEPLTQVRIFNTNTRKLIVAEVPVREGRAETDGDFELSGVPGTSARIVLNFVNSAGSKTGHLLPTGHVLDEMVLSDGRVISVSIVDAAAPAVFVRAEDIGLTGREVPDDIRRNPSIVPLLEEIRSNAGRLMGLARSPAIPKIGVVSPRQDYETISGATIRAGQCDLLARTLALGVLHKAYAVTGGICVSTAARIEGTVVNQVMAERAGSADLVRVGHPSGVSGYVIEVRRTAGGFELLRSAVAGTARRIMEGYVYLPGRGFSKAALEQTQQVPPERTDPHPDDNKQQ
jgi:methylitaconate Delta-isomerase